LLIAGAGALYQIGPASSIRYPVAANLVKGKLPGIRAFATWRHLVDPVPLNQNREATMIRSSLATALAATLTAARQHYAAVVALTESADPVRVEVAQARAFVEKTR
jgi:hypothetical protein